MPSDTLPAAADADHLTQVLRHHGVLAAERVTDVAVESSRATLMSSIIRLRLDYDGPAQAAPRFIILKTGQPARSDSTWNAGRQEVAFYRDVASAMTARLVPICFEASWDADTNAWHLLLEDLTDTHIVPTVWPLPPTTAQCETILDARARWHAAWWDDPRLAVTVGTRPDAEAIDRFLKGLAGAFAHFANTLGDTLPPDRRAFCERLVGAAPGMVARGATRRNVTIIHGDGHAWNNFLPRDGGTGVRLFDWDGWRIGVAATDLANMMAMHWYPDRRQRLESSLLDRYHATLVANGVRGYDREALTQDYRRTTLWLVTLPMWQAAAGIPPVVWWSNFERLMLAVDDLGCRDLLG